MKINNIKIHNFRSILNEDFFLNDYAVLVGENNSGKSNIISAIRIFYGDLKFDKVKDFPKLSGIELDEDSYIQITFKLNEQDQATIDDKYKSPDNLLILRKNLINNKLHAVNGDGDIFDEEFYGARGVADGKIGKVIFIPSVSRTEDILKTTGSSPFRDIINYVISDIIEKNTEFEIINEQLAHLNESLLDTKNGDGESISTIQRRVGEELSSWENINFKISMNQITSDMILKNLVSPLLLDKNQEIDIDKFGQGFQRSLIASLIKIDSEIKQNQKAKKIESKDRKIYSPDFTLILFEEPEAFLHFTQEDKMNNNLSDLSKEENKQVLISTHSNFFTSRNIDDLTSIIKLEKEESTLVSQISKEDLSELLDNNKEISGVLEKTPSYEIEAESLRYFLWLNQDRTSLFFAKYVFLVEGPTEKLFFDYLLNNDWSDIKPNGICIIDVGGKYNTVRYMNLLRAFRIKHYVLFDKDENKKTKAIDHAELNKYIASAKNMYTVGFDSFDKDIESFLSISTKGRNDKPLNILYNFKKEQAIDTILLFKLKLKLKKIFLGEEAFLRQENLINNLIKIHQNLLDLSRLVVLDNGEWDYKYNLAKELFNSIDFKNSYELKDGVIYRAMSDKYYLNICSNLTKEYTDGFHIFYELLTMTEPLEDEAQQIVDLYETIRGENDKL